MFLAMNQAIVASFNPWACPIYSGLDFFPFTFLLFSLPLFCCFNNPVYNLVLRLWQNTEVTENNILLLYDNIFSTNAILQA